MEEIDSGKLQIDGKDGFLNQMIKAVLEHGLHLESTIGTELSRETISKITVVYHYSWQREKLDNYTLNKQIEKAEKVANGQRAVKRDRFVKLTGKKPGVDWGLVERARQLMGLKGYITNISTEVLGPGWSITSTPAGSPLWHHIDQ